MWHCKLSGSHVLLSSCTCQRALKFKIFSSSRGGCPVLLSSFFAFVPHPHSSPGTPEVLKSRDDVFKRMILHSYDFHYCDIKLCISIKEKELFLKKRNTSVDYAIAIFLCGAPPRAARAARVSPGPCHGLAAALRPVRPSPLWLCRQQRFPMSTRHHVTIIFIFIFFL